MCILGLLLGRRTDVPFVCMHNRDETFTRPVEPPRDDMRIIFGRDVTAGGTWMGLNRDTGVFVSLTNVARRRDAPKGAVSRGHLVLGLLGAADDADGALAAPVVSLDAVRAAAAAAGADSDAGAAGAPLELGASYSGFNIVVGVVGGDGGAADVYFVTNRPPGTADAAGVPALTVLPPTAARVWRLHGGAFALSNSTLDDVSWVKVRWLRDHLSAALRRCDPWGASSAAGGASGGGGAAAAAGGTASDAGAMSDRDVLQTVLDHLLPVMTTQEALPAEDVMTDLSWSDVGPALEEFLQRHVFIPALDTYKYGTRATSAIVQVRDTVYYAYRDSDPPYVAGDAAAPPPRAPAGGDTVTAGGSVWRLFTTPITWARRHDAAAPAAAPAVAT